MSVQMLGENLLGDVGGVQFSGPDLLGDTAHRFDDLGPSAVA